MKALVTIAAVMTLAGCASVPVPTADPRVSGDADHVSVAGGRLDALPLAVFHCAKYGRSAQFSRTVGDRSMFDCVARGQ